MTSHNIFFINKCSATEESQDYALFGALPKLCHNPTGSPIYSNIFHSTTLQRDESWTVGMSSNYYAWCGTADGKLSENAKVQVNAGKLVSLGKSTARGTSLRMAVKEGRPAFDAKTALTASTDSFAIETGLDTKSGENVVFGVGAIDEDGILKPLATINAPSNAITNIAPISKFYLAAHSSSIGNVIDSTTYSDIAATIDFSRNTDAFGAVVIHEADRRFSVKYVSQGEYTKAIEAASIPAPAYVDVLKVPTPAADAKDLELAKLRQQIKDMQTLLDDARSATATPAPPTPTTSTPNTSASGSVNAADTAAAIIAAAAAHPGANPVNGVIVDPYPSKGPSTWYKSTLPFRNTPGQSRRRDIRDRMTQYMSSRGYTYEGGSIDNVLVALFSHHAGTYGKWHSVDDAASDWIDAHEALPTHLKGFIGSSAEGVVVRVQESKGLWRARGETESRPTPNAPKGEIYGNGMQVQVVQGLNGHGRTPSKNKTSSRPASPAPTSTPSKPLTNGVHAPSTPTPIRHASVTFGGKPVTNGATPSGVKPATAKAMNGVNGHSRKYSYPKVQETAMEAAKRRARAVLMAEGLAEYANGWKVSGF